MAGLTLDAGALIAADRLDRRFWTYWKLAMRRQIVVTVPASVVAEAWRSPRNANMARVLAATRVEPLDEILARRAGELCGATGWEDSVDAAVVVSGAQRGDAILTADPHDMQILTGAIGMRGPVIDLTVLPRQ